MGVGWIYLVLNMAVVYSVTVTSTGRVGVIMAQSLLRLPAEKMGLHERRCLWPLVSPPPIAFKEITWCMGR